MARLLETYCRLRFQFFLSCIFRQKQKVDEVTREAFNSS